jgi:hypothetical protein
METELRRKNATVFFDTLHADLRSLRSVENVIIQIFPGYSMFSLLLCLEVIQKQWVAVFILRSFLSSTYGRWQTQHESRKILPEDHLLPA